MLIIAKETPQIVSFCFCFLHLHVTIAQVSPGSFFFLLSSTILPSFCPQPKSKTNLNHSFLNAPLIYMGITSDLIYYNVLYDILLVKIIGNYTRCQFVFQHSLSWWAGDRIYVKYLANHQKNAYMWTSTWTM